MRTQTSPSRPLSGLQPAVAPRIDVAIPCFKVKAQIASVLQRIGPEVHRIWVVDDCCPQGSGRLVEESTTDERVRVLFNPENLGVGGAVMTGYRAALEDGADVVVKLDGDGQMDPALIPRLIGPILDGEADYAKGNRFFEPEGVSDMPRIRLFGNTVLSFLTKLSSGYWNIFDPTNGFTAVHREALSRLPLDKISRDYFFESDMLFRLSTLRAVVRDVEMKSVYGEEESSLRIGKIIAPFLYRNGRNLCKRIGYNYFLRDFNFASIELLLSTVLLGSGGSLGITKWLESVRTGAAATSGTVMLAALPVILGIQFLLGFLNYDLQNTPKNPLHPTLR